MSAQTAITTVRTPDGLHLAGTSSCRTALVRRLFWCMVGA